MRKVLLVSAVTALLFSPFFFSLPAHTSVSDRLLKDEAAKAELMKLNFFHKGLGMHISPSLIELVEKAEGLSRRTGRDFGPMKNRYGIYQQPDGKAIGLFNIEWEGLQVGVLGCVACHSSKVAGRFVIGIGNKNIDVGQIGADAFIGQSAWRAVRPDRVKPEHYKLVEDSAISFTKELADKKRRNLTQGLVPTSVIRKWFYRMAGEPYPEDMPRGAVKVPHLFGYAEKRKVGQFSDGGGNGLLPGWGIAVELAAGQTPENVRDYVHKIEHVENLLGDLLPPEYPFSIDRARADRGKKTFVKNCSGCHGTYEKDDAGLPIYKEPKIIPWSVVKTDHERLDQLDDRFLGLIERSPLSDIIQQTSTKESYIAPRLHAVWARFPYLHNASVPTLYDLLSKAEKRPKYFELKDAGEEERFDPVHLGLQVRGAHEVRRAPILANRSVYDTTQVGQTNVGHEFHTDLSEDEKFDLIEYLKTL